MQRSLGEATLRVVDGRVLRDLERTFGAAGARFRLTVTCTSQLPPVEQVGTAHCLAFDDEGRIVLAEHVDRRWTIPGGHLEPGETPEAAMHREAAEEAGAVVRDPEVLAVERIERLSGDPVDARYTNPSFQVFYGARLVSLGAPTALEECSSSRLFTPEEARRTPGWVQDLPELYEEGLRWATS